MGIIQTIVSSVGGILGNKAGDLIGQRIEAHRSGTEESDGEESGQSLRSRLQSVRAKLGERWSADEGGEESGDDQSRGIGGRISNLMPDADRLSQTMTAIMDEVSDDDVSSPDTAGQQLGEMVGQQLGEMISRTLNSDSGTEESSGS